MMESLDLRSLAKAVGQLAAGIAQAEADPKNELLRDGVIQRFQYTYELSWKMLKRYLAAVSANPQDVDAMSCQTLIRTGSEYGLLLSGWDAWLRCRTARGITSHTYDAEKAHEVFAIAPQFLHEAQYLLDRLSQQTQHP